MRRVLPLLIGSCLLLTGCGGEPTSTPTARPTATATPTVSPTPTPTPTQTQAPGTVAPQWLGKRVLPKRPDGFGLMPPTPRELRHRRFTLPDRLPMLPGAGYQARIDEPTPAVLARSTWAPGCPVGARELAWIRLTFWGFDSRRHTGELLVHQEVARDLVEVFGELYRARFPMEELRITTKAERDAAATSGPTGDGNNTGAFNCRPTTGGSSYSQHAYGLAVDINPFQNPYLKGDVVLPELARVYTDRSRQAPGMIHAGDAVVRAFARVGWEWGGAWRTLKDWQHFSRDGR